MILDDLLTIFPLKGIVSWLEKKTGPPAVAVKVLISLSIAAIEITPPPLAV